MSNYIIKEKTLSDIASAIREKTGNNEPILVSDMANQINNIENDGIDTSDATAIASDILADKTAYVNDEKITGTIATKTVNDLSVSGNKVTVPSGYYASNVEKSVATATQATPSISVNSSGLITASVTQSAGYVSAGTKSETKQLTTQAAKTITPTKYEQTAVASGKYTTDDVIVTAIPDVYVNTSDATASADEIFLNETAYVNGKKITGTFTIEDEMTNQTNLISQIVSALEGKAAGGGSGSGGSNITFGTLNVEDMGMYEPGINEFILSSDNLQTSTRHIILLHCSGFDILTFIRESLTDSFFINKGASHHYNFGTDQVVINENNMRVLGTSYSTETLSFVAF